MSAPKTTRFLIMSDTHGVELPSDLPYCDVLLHCGDLTEDGSPQSIAAALQALSRVKAELRLVIAGNHEISLDKTYYLAQKGAEADVGEAHALVSPEAASQASKSGTIFLSEGTRRFTLASGATFRIYASPYTPADGASAFQYPTNEDRFNCGSSTAAWAKNVGTPSSIIPNGVDIIMTHGPAKYILDTTSDNQSAGCEHLRRAINRVRPKLHCFGHIHPGYGGQRLEYEEKKTEDEDDGIKPLGKEFAGKGQAKRKGYAGLPPGSQEDFRQSKQTLCINAAMEGEKGVLENRPWLVELDLPVANRREDTESAGARGRVIHTPSIFPPHTTFNMTTSSSLVLYRPNLSSSLSSKPSSTSLIPFPSFTHQTGTAIATELLYRLLYDIMNRFLASFQRLASRGVEEASSWIERKLQERREAKATKGSMIVEEVGKLTQQRGFRNACPIGGDRGGKGAPQPPLWVKSVLVGIEEGRLHGRDFWTNSW
ncbi:Metallo-dependent phosphatase-like protein [Ampelomyces quisqualis]|uniref:Metallo-dependent phosphatase-like protein n=1 Tax=Ampelomyces quisqualis TaxID=50730 RepID=A0A6A5QGB1_AMPQU|nr:Metallo-dependent phosphatase-like protein [Ampelomyces quisqualis]